MSTDSYADLLAKYLSGITLDVDDIREWRSIVTLIVFIITNLTVLFPFPIPWYLPEFLLRWMTRTLKYIRVLPKSHQARWDEPKNFWFRFWFPINFMTAPLVADLFLIAILAIGRQEVYDGTVGANGITPLYIMVFFLTLAYIAISIDASGLIRYLAFRVLLLGGKVGHRLFFALYAFFFGLGTFIGNDPIILSGTAFLAYMTRVSSNIEHPRAWIHSQFAVANIASAILVSSNPTNLVLAGAFSIRFVDYTVNMVVPVIVTAIVMFPFLLYVIFAHQRLIPTQINMHELPEELKNKQAVNPNIPNARGDVGQFQNANATAEETAAQEKKERLLSLEEIMNPFLDKIGAIFGAAVMTVTLIMVLALNAAAQKIGENPVYYVTLPAAAIMLAWDLTFGWKNRVVTRKIARDGRKQIEEAQQERMRAKYTPSLRSPAASSHRPSQELHEEQDEKNPTNIVDGLALTQSPSRPDTARKTSAGVHQERLEPPYHEKHKHLTHRDVEPAVEANLPHHIGDGWSLVSKAEDAYRWCQETFPTVTAVLAHLPFALVPFALCMFVLVEALVTKGWVPVFAYGWDHWVNKTGTVGAIGGMGFLSVVLCNFAGTNIGTTILLSRVLQCWIKIHENDSGPSDRDFWASVYAMALGVNFGAFSTAFSASLAGLLWRDILGRKHIRVSRSEFARVNLPIIAIAMVVGCTVLIGEVYLTRDGSKKYGLTLNNA